MRRLDQRTLSALSAVGLKNTHPEQCSKPGDCFNTAPLHWHKQLVIKLYEKHEQQLMYSTTAHGIHACMQLHGPTAWTKVNAMSFLTHPLEPATALVKKQAEGRAGWYCPNEGLCLGATCWKILNSSGERARSLLSWGGVCTSSPPSIPPRRITVCRASCLSMCVLLSLNMPACNTPPACHS